MEIKCELIRDILPLYVEGLCGDYTKAVVAEHIADCPDCGGLLSELVSENAETAKRGESKKAAEPFLKVRRRNRVKLAGVSTVSVIAFAAMFIRLFLVGHRSKYSL
ncbi:hypothetical protein FACS189490_13300 [Clostridia bacterium]|nr:hypothetical protein FACS189490_13300 [Clostridia bacterium]